MGKYHNIRVTDEVLKGMEQLKIPYDILKEAEKEAEKEGEKGETSNLVLALKSNYPENMPKKVKLEFLTDKKEFEEVIKYGNSFLRNPNEVLEEINYNKELGVVVGSMPKFVVLYGQFLRNINDKFRSPITTGQLEDFLYMIHKKCWVDDGLHLTGVGNINHDESEAIYNDFLKRGIEKVDSRGYLKNSIRMDLTNLDLNKNGLFRLRDDSIWCETNKLIGDNYNFKEIDKFGIPIENQCGDKTCYVVNKKTKPGLFRCGSVRDMDSDAGYECLRCSYPHDRVVLANSRSE